MVSRRWGRKESKDIIFFFCLFYSQQTERTEILKNGGFLVRSGISMERRHFSPRVTHFDPFNHLWKCCVPWPRERPRLARRHWPIHSCLALPLVSHTHTQTLPSDRVPLIGLWHAHTDTFVVERDSRWIYFLHNSSFPIRFPHGNLCFQL